MVLAYPFLGMFGSMMVFFLWVAWFVLLFHVDRGRVPPARCERREEGPLADLRALLPVRRRLRLPDRQQRRHGGTELRADGGVTAVCRWLAYSGTPVLLDELLYKPKYSLIDQSLHSRLGATTTNGDGFGVGWYGVGDTPALFHSMEPAWNDRNLQELARHTSSPLVFAHIRASTGTAVQQTNCHPFRHGRWLWMHNGAIRDFDRVKRDLRFAIDPELYAEIEGSTDSETFFYLALTFGLEEDPPKAVQEAVGFIEETGRQSRRRASDPDDGRDHGRRERLGVPLLERGRFALALLQHRHAHAEDRSTPTTCGCR